MSAATEPSERRPPPGAARSVTVTPLDARVHAVAAGLIVVDTRRTLVMLESGHPPVYYLPRRDFRPGVLVPVRFSTFCARKGTAWYWDVHRADRVEELAAWTYPSAGGRRDLGDYAALRWTAVDQWFVDGEPVTEPRQ